MANYTIANAAALMGALDAEYTAAKQFSLQLFTQNPGPSDPTYPTIISEASGQTPQLQSLVSQYATMANLLEPEASYVSYQPIALPLSNSSVSLTSPSILLPLAQTAIPTGSSFFGFSGGICTISLNGITPSQYMNLYPVGSITLSGITAPSGALALNGTFTTTSVGVGVIKFATSVTTAPTSPAVIPLTFNPNAFLTISGTTVATIFIPYNPSDIGIVLGSSVTISGITAPSGAMALNGTWSVGGVTSAGTYNPANFQITVPNTVTTTPSTPFNVSFSNFQLTTGTPNTCQLTLPIPLNLSSKSYINISGVSNTGATPLNGSIQVTSASSTSTSTTVNFTTTATATPVTTGLTGPVTVTAATSLFALNSFPSTLPIFSFPLALTVGITTITLPNNVPPQAYGIGVGTSVTFSGITMPSGALPFNGTFSVLSVNAATASFTIANPTGATATPTQPFTGISFSLGSVIAPATVCTVTPSISPLSLGMYAGGQVTISGITAPSGAMALNGTWSVTSVTSTAFTFTTSATTTPTAGSPTFELVGCPNNCLLSYIPYSIYLAATGTNLVTATFPYGVNPGLSVGDQIIVSNSTLTGANTPTAAAPSILPISSFTSFVSGASVTITLPNSVNPQTYAIGVGTSVTLGSTIPITAPSGATGLNGTFPVTSVTSTTFTINTASATTSVTAIPTTPSTGVSFASSVLLYSTISTVTTTGFTYNAASTVTAGTDTTGGASFQRIA